MIYSKTTPLTSGGRLKGAAKPWAAQRGNPAIQTSSDCSVHPRSIDYKCRPKL